MMAAQIIQGRRIGAAELEQIRQLLDQHPHWSRRRLSERLAQLWDWRNGAGRLKDMAARTLLLKLQERGWIALPPRAGVSRSIGCGTSACRRSCCRWRPWR